MNYYEVLGIGVTATKDEVRSAYIMKLRQYPAEFHPEMFHTIQEAYQVLGNEEKRKNYDTEELYGDEIKRLKSKGGLAYDEEDYEGARQAYKELLNYFPKDTGIMNMYALSLLKVGNEGEAISYWNKAIELDENNAIYHYNLGTAYEQKSDIRRAIRCYKQAIICNPNEYVFVEHLSSIYFDMEDYENAWYIVELAMKKENVQGGLKVVFLMRLLKLAVMIKGQFEMKLALKYVKNFITKQPDEKENILIEMYNFVIELRRLKNFQWAIPIIDFVREHDPSDVDTKRIHETTHENYLIYKEFDSLYDDEGVLSELRYKIYLYLYSDEFEDADERIEYANEEVYEVCRDMPSRVRTSISNLKKNYPIISREMKKWIEVIESCI